MLCGPPAVPPSAADSDSGLFPLTTFRLAYGPQYGCSRFSAPSAPPRASPTRYISTAQARAHTKAQTTNERNSERVTNERVRQASAGLSLSSPPSRYSIEHLACGVEQGLARLVRRLAQAGAAERGEGAKAATDEGTLLRVRASARAKLRVRARVGFRVRV